MLAAAASSTTNRGLISRAAGVLRVLLSLLLLPGIAAVRIRAADQIRFRADPPGALVWLDGFQCGFDLHTQEGLSNLVRMVDLWVALSEAEQSRLAADRTHLIAAVALADMPYEQLKKYFADPPDYITPKERRGLREIRRWATAALDQPSGAARDRSLAMIGELAAALNNDRRSVVPEKLGVSQIPMLLRRGLNNPVAKGRRPAENVVPSPGNDFSRADPERSSFWEPPRAISAEDLFAGYGRSALPDLTNAVWKYRGPKTGSGISPGFRAKDGSTHIKVKFQEITSEPFTARVFWALGYHVDPVDYVPFLKIRYDRRLLRELHLRHEAPIPVKLFGISVFHFHYQPRFDPFQFIAQAVLKDGTRLSGAELRQRLYKNASLEHPEEDPANFRPECERQIAYLITSPASVQIRDHHLKSIGPWDFQGLGHENLRELRAAGLLSAWLNWCDSQFHNTRVRLIKSKKHPRYEYYFCDLGGGMGKGTGFFFRRYESPNDLAWTFTRPGNFQGDGSRPGSFQIVGYKPVDDTAAFKEMTRDDALWMARRIGQLTEGQLLEALVASGFDSAQARVFLEKLVGRRDQMIADLGLSQEVGLLRPDGPERDCSYDPKKDGPVRIRLRSGQTIEAQPSDWIVVHGRVVPDPSVPGADESRTPAHQPQILSLRK